MTDRGVTWIQSTDVYVAAAKVHGAVLVSLDREQLARAKGIIETMTPAEFLKKQPAGGSTVGRRKPGG